MAEKVRRLGKKQILVLMACVIVVIVIACVGIRNYVNGNYFTSEYKHKTAEYKVESLSVELPESFDGEDDDTDSIFSYYSYEESKEIDIPDPFVINIRYIGIKDPGKDIISYINDEDRKYYDEDSSEISGKGYSGIEIKDASGKESDKKSDKESPSYIRTADYIFVDDSVFLIELSELDKYYSEKNMSTLRDHINFDQYKSNHVVRLDAEYTGDKGPGDLLDKNSVRVTAVLDNGTEKFIDAEDRTVTCPNGNKFKEGKDLTVDVAYTEGGKEYTTTIKCKCESTPPATSSGSSGGSSSSNYNSDGNYTYNKDDELGKEWDTDNDGAVSGNEFQDAVNNYMTEHGY